MSVESAVEQALERMQSVLQGIVSDGGEAYWYTPDEVVRYPMMTLSCLNTTNDVVYVLSPDDVTVEEATITSKKIMAPVDISMAMRFAPASENPFDPPDQDRMLIQSRLLQDVRKKLEADGTLGGAVCWAHIQLESRKAEETYVQGWAMAFLRVTLEIYTPDGAP